MNKAQRNLYAPVESAERALEKAREEFLRASGWTNTTDSMTCMWMWVKNATPGTWVKRWNDEHPELADREKEQPVHYRVMRSEDAVRIQLHMWDLGHDIRTASPPEGGASE